MTTPDHVCFLLFRSQKVLTLFLLMCIFFCQKPWLGPGQGQAVCGGFGWVHDFSGPEPPQAKPKPGLLGQARPGKSLYGRDHEERKKKKKRRERDTSTKA